MSKELDLLIPLIDNRRTMIVNEICFHLGTFEHHEVVVMQCGIGKVNAAVGAMTMIDKFAPDLIVNTGVAGGTGYGARILDVVLGTKVAYHDVWCGPCAERGQIQGMPRFFEAPDYVSEMKQLENVPGLHKGLIASGDCFVDNARQLEEIRALYPDVMAVDMESAAIAQVCHIKNVPFVSMRVISDTPGDDVDNTSQYNNFWEDAPKHTFSVLRTLISGL